MAAARVIDLTVSSDEEDSSPIPVGRRRCAKAKLVVSCHPSDSSVRATSGRDEEDNLPMPAGRRRVMASALRGSCHDSPSPNVKDGPDSEDHHVAQEAPAGTNASKDASNPRQGTAAATKTKSDCGFHDSMSRGASMHSSKAENPFFNSLSVTKPNGQDAPAMLRGNSSAAPDPEHRSISRITPDDSKQQIAGSSERHNERVTSHSSSVVTDEEISHRNHSVLHDDSDAREAAQTQMSTRPPPKRVATDEAQMARPTGYADNRRRTTRQSRYSTKKTESNTLERHHEHDGTDVETEMEPQRTKHVNQVDTKQQHHCSMAMQPMRSAHNELASQAPIGSKKTGDVFRDLPKRFLEDHEYFSKHRMMKARRSHEMTLGTADAAAETLQCSNGPSLLPMKYLQKESPFKSMKAIQTPSQPRNPELCLKRMQNTFGRPENGKIVVEPRSKSSYNTLIEYRPESAILPSYDSFVSHKQSTVAENQDTLLHPPYLSDESSEDEESKETWEELLDNKYELMWKERPTRAAQAELAWQLRPYVERVLKKVDCDINDVIKDKMIRGILGAERRLIPNSLLDRLWLSAKEVPAVAITTRSLNDAFGFSIYPVLALIFVQEETRALSRTKDDETNHKNSFEYREIACRICHVHNCPFHGQITPGNVKRHIITMPRQQVLRDGVISQRRNAAFWGNETNANSHDKRPPFVPCDHQGNCEEAHCQCFRDGVQCEKSCACPSSCGRRFEGCNCAAKYGACWKRERCPCFILNRECDPDLCARCGADEVLDPANRYDDGLVSTKCANVSIQRNVARRTLLGRSEVDGFGLFMGEDVKTDEFLGEYTGEIVSKDEAARRDEIYTHQRKLFLFELNMEQDVDATKAGNKFRFLNSSTVDPNVYPKVLLCNTVHRIGLFAKKDIKAGEEMFFDYNFNPEGFIERGTVAGIVSKANDLKAVDRTNPPHQRRKEDKEPNGQGSVPKRIAQHANNQQNGRISPLYGAADGYETDTA